MSRKGAKNGNTGVKCWSVESMMYCRHIHLVMANYTAQKDIVAGVSFYRHTARLTIFMTYIVTGEVPA